ncbi:dihydrofolate reductase [Kiritimatiellota bacterium B12222]|nr:dihydrofolate reductase [Kiritimatiellota bacterium B12222]
MNETEWVMIVAMDRQQVIGKHNQLPWKLSADLKKFKEITLGSPILMGRKTWNSIGRPLPGRQNLVLTRQLDFIATGAEVVHTLSEAEAKVQGARRLFVIGGEEIYRLCLPQAQRLYITHVETDVEGGDAFFPEWNLSDYQEIGCEHFHADEKNEFDFRFVEYAKKSSDS